MQNADCLPFESLVLRDLRVYAGAHDGDVHHYRDNTGLEVDAVVETAAGEWLAAEAKLDGDKAIDTAARNLLKLRARIDTDAVGEPSKLIVVTAIGSYCYDRPDVVAVVPNPRARTLTKRALLASRPTSIPRRQEFIVSDMPPPPPDDSGWSSQPPPPPGQPASTPQAGTGWATYGTGENAELAGAGSRLGARLIDAVIFAIVAIVLFIVVAVASFGELVDDAAVDDDAIEEAFEGLIVVPLVVVAVGMLYEVSLTAMKGQTLGKMAVRIRVVGAESGSVPGWGKAFGRWFVPSIVSVISLWISFVGFLALVIYASLLWDKRRQGWHDKVAKTLVIKA